MSGVIIYLGRLSPIASSDQPETSGPHTFPFGLASDGVYRDPCCYQQSGGLLHHLSTLTPACRCGIFLLHFPWSRLRQTLSGTLPFEARTFLSCILSVMQQRPSVLLRTSLLYHNFFRMSIPPFWHFLLSLYTFRQLPPINSRIMEFLGMISLSIPRK